ncbi:MAG: UDP-glucose 4-epimerase GalE [Thermodesulfobacteriota bacterium]
MKVLVVGGAGYIGSFMVRLLEEKGIEPIVFDNLSTGHRSAVAPSTMFVRGDLSDQRRIRQVLSSISVDAIMHFASFIEVGESVSEPVRYYYNNVANTIGLLKAMRESRVNRFIFSSSAAVYGNPKTVPIDESHEKRPVNPYGWTKYMVEQILEDISKASEFRYVSLRYFNAAGGDPDGRMGEDHSPETHLIPRLLNSVLKTGIREPLEIFGSDYDTPDGTCIRDYVHVMDLVQAHLLALTYLLDGGRSEVFNLGSGQGASVREVIRAAEKITGMQVPVVEAGRRPGDPPVLIADSKKISKKLGWQPGFSELESVIQTAWKWHSGSPSGYSTSVRRPRKRKEAI